MVFNMEIKNKSLKEKIIIFGQIIFWLYVIFSFSFNFVEDVMSYDQVQTLGGANIEQSVKNIYDQPAESTPTKSYILKE